MNWYLSLYSTPNFRDPEDKIASRVASRTRAAEGIGGPDIISNSGILQARDDDGLSSSGGGGNWTVASAAKFIFGRARSQSSPNPIPDTSSAPTSVRAPSPSPLSQSTQRSTISQREDESTSPTRSAMSIPVDPHIAHARLYPSAPNSSAPSPVLTPASSQRNSIDVPPNSPTNFPTGGVVKTLCNRSAAIVSVHLAEPVLFLAGFEPSEYSDRSPAVLRGSLILKLLKPSKIKTIALVFKGRARTEWPEGIPPKRVEFFEEKELVTHTWPFFNAQFSCSETSHGANAIRMIESHGLSADLRRDSMDSISTISLGDAPALRSITPIGSPNLSASNGGHRGIPFGQALSLSKEDKTTTQARGYRIFAAGEYMYVFSLIFLIADIISSYHSTLAFQNQLNVTWVQ